MDIGAGQGDADWVETENALRREFVFRNFSEAFGFMTRVAMVAETHDHHPDWSNSWNRVVISLTTHSVGGRVTELDRRVAAAVDQLVET
jgi:4a-hydroxytetrahydrobiopterin dehydratase